MFSGHNSSSTSTHPCKSAHGRRKIRRRWNKIKLYPRIFRKKAGSTASNRASPQFCTLTMPETTQKPRPLAHVRRAVIEVAFIIFLFYSNLLMGEFNRVNGPGKTFAVALDDIFTIKNFAIAIIAASIGYVAFEYLRKKP